VKRKPGAMRPPTLRKEKFHLPGDDAVEVILETNLHGGDPLPRRDRFRTGTEAQDRPNPTGIEPFITPGPWAGRKGMFPGRLLFLYASQQREADHPIAQIEGEVLGPLGPTNEGHLPLVLQDDILHPRRKRDRTDRLPFEKPPQLHPTEESGRPFPLGIQHPPAKGCQEPLDPIPAVPAQIPAESAPGNRKPIGRVRREVDPSNDPTCLPVRRVSPVVFFCLKTHFKIRSDLRAARPPLREGKPDLSSFPQKAPPPSMGLDPSFDTRRPSSIPADLPPIEPFRPLLTRRLPARGERDVPPTDEPAGHPRGPSDKIFPSVGRRRRHREGYPRRPQPGQHRPLGRIQFLQLSGQDAEALHRFSSRREKSPPVEPPHDDLVSLP
jgi:hypothetical protein